MAPQSTSPDGLIARLPLPLAQLFRRAHNAIAPLERFHAAYYTWEAGLKLLASACIVEYAACPAQDAEVNAVLQALARPAIGHWWAFVKNSSPSSPGPGSRRRASWTRSCWGTRGAATCRCVPACGRR
jgi:hypothetical protein